MGKSWLSEKGIRDFEFIFNSYTEQATLTLSWRRPISYRNQSIDLLRKSMDWFLYDIGLRHERVSRELNFAISRMEIYYFKDFARI